MPLFDIQLPKRLARALRLPTNDPYRQQRRVLRKLWIKQDLLSLANILDLTRYLSTNIQKKNFRN